MLGQLSMGGTRRLNRHYQSQNTKHEYIFNEWSTGVNHTTPVQWEKKRYKYKRVIIEGFLPRGCFGIELNAGGGTLDIVAHIENEGMYFNCFGFHYTGGQINEKTTPIIPTENVQVSTFQTITSPVTGYFKCMCEFSQPVYNIPNYIKAGLIQAQIYNFNSVIDCEIKVIKE